MTILIVDDDKHIRELMKLSLKEEGFRIVEAPDGEAALERLRETQVHLVVLDVMMPRMDGFELCRQIRRKHADLPLLMVTAKGETGDKLEGFQLGADDYVVKPFDPRELVMRVKSLLKRFKLASSERIRCGQVELDKKAFEVIRDGQPVTLPLKEFELFYMLASHPNQILTRNQIIESIWGLDYEGDDRTVDVHIKRLRERFSSEEQGFLIKTIRGLGYKLELQA